MKTTYKLFGTYWDGMESIKNEDLNIGKTNDYRLPSVSFQQLLSVQNESEYDAIISPFKDYKTISIGIDYWTDSGNPVLCAFLRKRLCQMVSHLAKTFVEVRCAME